MTTPRSVRFDADVQRRLASFVARHHGTSASGVAARLVDEGLRMDEHPGVVFRDGPAGRRTGLAGGPDVWAVVRAVRSARGAEPGLAEPALLRLVADNAGLSLHQVRTAVDYWASYPDEVDVMVEHADRLEVELLRSAERTSGLLRR